MSQTGTSLTRINLTQNTRPAMWTGSGPAGRHREGSGTNRQNGSLPGLCPGLAKECASLSASK